MLSKTKWVDVLWNESFVVVLLSSLTAWSHDSTFHKVTEVRVVMDGEKDELSSRSTHPPHLQQHSPSLWHSGDTTSNRNLKLWYSFNCFKQADPIMCYCRCLCQRNLNEMPDRVLYTLLSETQSEIKWVSVGTLLLCVENILLWVINSVRKHLLSL